MTLRPNDYDRNGDIIPDSVREEKGDLISRSELKENRPEFLNQNQRGHTQYNSGWNDAISYFLDLIDNAPTVEPICPYLSDDEVKQPCIQAPCERPKGEYEFIEILAQYVPDDICIYPEYKGKPYYSIHFKQKGEEFVGFGTYKPEVLSRYLKEYFIKGGADIRGNDK